MRHRRQETEELAANFEERQQLNEDQNLEEETQNFLLIAKMWRVMIRILKKKTKKGIHWMVIRRIVFQLRLQFVKAMKEQMEACHKITHPTSDASRSDQPSVQDISRGKKVQ